MAITKSILREQFGRRLGRIRNRQKLSSRQLATLLKVSQSTVSKIENGHLNASREYLDRLIKALHVDTTEAAELFHDWERFKNKLDRIQLGAEGEFTRMQSNVSALEYQEFSAFSFGLISGPLQTEKYIKAVFTDPQRDSGSDNLRHDLARAIEERKQQASKLLDSQRSFRFILAENCLKTLVCTHEALKDQLAHLVAMNKRRNVSIGLLPTDTNYIEAKLECPMHGFDLFDRKLLGIEINFGWLNIWDEELVGEYDHYFDALLSVSFRDGAFEGALRKIALSL